MERFPERFSLNTCDVLRSEPIKYGIAGAKFLFRAENIFIIVERRHFVLLEPLSTEKI